MDGEAERPERIDASRSTERFVGSSKLNDGYSNDWVLKLRTFELLLTGFSSVGLEVENPRATETC